MATGSQASDFDIETFVEKTAYDYKEQTGVIVSQDARRLLIDQALPYQERVLDELTQGAITIEYLRQTLLTLFDNARSDIDVGADIDVSAIRRAEDRYCPYLFWC